MRYVLRGKQGDEVAISLDGDRVILYDETVQEFPSSAAAKEHHERLLFLASKRGYHVVRTEELAAAPPSVAEASDDLTVNPAKDGRFTVAFKGGGAASPAVCERVVQKLTTAAPAAVHLICDHAVPGASWAAAVAGKEVTSVKTFVFDTDFESQALQGKNSLGDLAVTLHAFPAVERMFVTGKLVTEAATHLHLRELYLLGDPITPAFLRCLSGWTLPALERFVLSLASEAAPPSERALSSALQLLAAPRLREVHVQALGDVTATIAALAANGKVPWATLSLDGAVEDEDQLLAVLEKHAAWLRGFQALGLPLGEISTDGSERATALLPAVRDAREWREVTLPQVYAGWR